jgi:hypothetical protein
MIDPRLSEPRYLPGAGVSTWPYVKVARAREHLTHLHAAARLWVADDPVATRQEISEDRMRWSLVSVVRQPPPLNQWSTIVGDCVHNLRSALDAAVWELSSLSGNPAHPDWVAFPIVSTPKEWNDRLKRGLHAVPDHIIERVKAVQPMMLDPEDRSGDPLAILARLNNDDKHRSSLACGLDANEVKLHWSLTHNDNPGAPQLRLDDLSLEDGRVLAEYDAESPILDSRGEFTLGYALTIDTPLGRQPALDLLDRLVDYVGDVLMLLHGRAELVEPAPDQTAGMNDGAPPQSTDEPDGGRSGWAVKRQPVTEWKSALER